MAKADQFSVEYHHRHYPSQVAQRYEVMSRVGDAPNVAYFVIRDKDKRFLGTLVTISTKKMSRAADAITRLTAAIQKEVAKGTGTFAALKKATISLRAANEKTAPPDKGRKAATVAGPKAAPPKPAGKTTAGKPAAGKTTSGAKAAKPAPKTTAGAKPAARTTSGSKPTPKTTAGKAPAAKTTAGSKTPPAKPAVTVAGPGKKKGKKAAAAAKKAEAAPAGKKKGKKKGKKAARTDNGRKAAADGALPPPGMPSEERFWNNDSDFQQEARSVGLATGSYPQSMLPAAPGAEQYAGVVGGPSSQTEREWQEFVRQVQDAERQQRSGGTAQGHTTGAASGGDVAPYEQYMGIFYPDR